MATAALHAHWPDEWAPPRSDGSPPPELLHQLEEGVRDAERNLGPSVNVDGNRWEKERTMACGVEVWCARAARSSARMFRIKGTVPLHLVETVYSQLAVCENKRGWDTESISWVRRLKCFTGTEPRDKVDIEVYTSHPAVGGLVKPRAFADARLTRFNADGSIVSIVRAVDGAHLSRWGLADFERLAKAAGLQRARNLPGGGCGVKFWPLPDGGARFEMMAHSELGGWLPQGTINAATGQVLGNIAVGCIRHLEKLPVEKLPAAQKRPATPPSPQPCAPSVSRTGPATPAVAGGRRRRRIRAPGCHDDTRYSWRWVGEGMG